MNKNLKCFIKCLFAPVLIVYIIVSILLFPVYILLSMIPIIAGCIDWDDFPIDTYVGIIGFPIFTYREW